MNMDRKHIAPLILVLAVAWSVTARADQVDEHLKEQMQRRRIPGLALAVVRDGRVIKTKGYGLANLELQTPVTPETVFEIGSITKQFTAALVLMLAEEGKLGLDDKLGKHLPGWPAGWEAITVRHLLTHTSGLTNYTGLKGFEASRKLTAGQFLQALSPYPLNFQPGDSWSYCNSAYNLLGYLLEKITGKSYWELLRERIFQPLGMTASQSRDLKTILPRRAAGYEIENGRLVNRDSDLTDVFAAGAITSTVLDLVKWNAALDSDRLLSRSSREQMWTAVRLNSGTNYPYGLGWGLETWRGQKNLGHSGSTSGFSATLQRFPDHKLAVIVLCNLDERGVATALAKDVAGFYIPALALTASREPPGTRAPKTLKR